jgi:serine/threonine protein kinase/WD40 repeat protein
MTPAPEGRTARLPAANGWPGDSEHAANNPRLAEAVEEYRSTLQAGRRPDRQALCARYADLGAALAECLDALEFVHGATPASDAAGPVAVQPGEPLGDYRILREVGRGGMGVVYEAEQVSLRRLVALKVLPFAAVLDPRQLQRFRTEAQAAAGLHHPHIVPVYHVGCERGVHYYAMQLIDGQSLAAVIQGLRRQAGGTSPGTGPSLTLPWVPLEAADSARALPAAADTHKVLATDRSRQKPAYFRAVARLGAQAAVALDHAHQQGVIHRDVKPANLLVDAAGNLWVTDFGLAQLPGDPGLTATGDLVGTLRYMSPEQALGRRQLVDQRTDVYSLGVTLYELLTLEPAFPGSDREELLRRIAREEPRPPRRLNRAVPVELETVVAKAMAKVPEERYATAAELADDLRRFLEDRPVLARRPSPLVKLRKWAWRHRGLVAAAAVTLVLLVAALACGMMAYGFQQAQLAERSDKLAKDKDELARVTGQALQEANERLHEALLGRATGIRLARQPGYRRPMWDDLHCAMRLDVPRKDLATIRREVLAALGDPIGLEPSGDEKPLRRRPAPVPAALARLRWGQPDEPYAVSADGQWLAKRGNPFRPSRDGVDFYWVQVVDRKGTVHGAGPCPLGAIYALQFTSDGRFLVAGCEKGVVAWVTLPELPLRSLLGTGNVTSLDIHPNGRLLAIRGHGVELWSLVTNRLIASFDVPGRVTKVEFSADGRWLLAVRDDAVVRAWPVTGTPEKMILDGHADGVPEVAFSPDGRLLASVSKDRTARLWEVGSGKLVHVLKGHEAPIEAVAFSPNGWWLATGDINGLVIVWDPRTGARVGKDDSRTGLGPRPPGQIWRLQFSPAGTHLAAAGGLGVMVWQVRTNGDDVSLHPFVHTVPPNKTFECYDVAVHPSGFDFVFLDKAGRLFRCAAALGATPKQLGAPAMVQLRGLHFDGKGERLTFPGRGGKLGIWNWRTDKARLTTQQVIHLALDGSGRWAASSSPAHGLVVYDATAEQPLFTLPSEASDIWSLAWSPDGRRVALGLADGGVVLWDLEQVRAELAAFGIEAPSTLSRPVRARTKAAG